MTKFFFKFTKPYFWLFLGHISQCFGQKSFSKKLGCHAQFHMGFWHHAKIQRNLMIQFQESTQTDIRREGMMTDPISQDLCSYRQGTNKYNCSRLTFKSQWYSRRATQSLLKIEKSYMRFLKQRQKALETCWGCGQCSWGFGGTVSLPQQVQGRALLGARRQSPWKLLEIWLH